MRCVTSRIVPRALEKIVLKTHDEKQKQDNCTTAGRNQLTNQLTSRTQRLSDCRAGCHVERVATAREEVLPSLPPATLA